MIYSCWFMMQDYENLSEGETFSENWDTPRIPQACINLEASASNPPIQRLAEEVFRIFNAPDELLTAQDIQQRDVFSFGSRYTGPSLSVGDVVKIRDDHGLVAECLCLGTGWDIRLKR